MANKVIDHVRVELDSHFLTVSPNKTVPDLVIQILVRELMCSKHLVRFGVRFGLQHLASATCTTVGNLLAGQSSVLKQLLLSRPLRLLPLPEQVGIVESLAFIIARAPSVFSLSESNLLRCLSDLLTMASGADGETTVRIEPGIDKDGHATVNKNSPNKDLNLVTTHASAIFLRGSCKVLLKHQKTEVQIAVPAELPMGVQLRVSILLLFHEIILKHTVEFFEAPASTSIGNIRPHVISLLFRSLISHPPQAVSAAHTALKYILSMSSGPKGQSVDSPSSSHNRLPKEIPKDLLQACLRPVLLNLSDYRKLTVPLLRGLSRLLSLLSSWFNKTLGEKLIDHLRNWSNPAKIMHDGIWRPGEEPLVAAEIVGLFELLPQASFFVEPLVCVCIDLETKLSKFKGFSGTTSPYRVPLTKYLNKYAKETVNFFMRKQRLGNSIFSDLFQEVINQPYASKIRSYLSGTEGTSLLAQLCFNRPFDVEKKVDAARKKGGASVMSAEYLSVHGIVDYDLDDDDQSDLLQISLQRTLDEKKTKSHLAKKGAEKAHMQYVAFTKTPSATEVQIHDAKIRRDLAFEEMKDAEKEEELASQALHNAMKKKEAPELIASQQNAGVGDDGTISVKMTRGSLELLLQGITIIQTLMQWDGDYVRGSNHKNIASTIRYLWKGRGRRLRLINEDRMHPKYHAESYLYAQFLMKYFRLHTMDVSLLFELLIIFLHPTSIDFSFVKEFLETVVSTILSEPSKRKLLLRFFGVLNMEGADIETIILSMQILVEPMLRYHFETENAKGKLGGRQPASRGSVAAEKKETEQGIIIHSSLDVNAGNRSDIVDATVIQDFMLKAIAANSNVVVSSRSERFHVELLKMSTLFIQFMGKEMMEYRKELIKFAWNHLKSEDSISKHWAYINVCRFIDTYETPSKIILQVYVALLRTHQPEARDSVTSALDILIPALRRRLPVADFIKAIKWTKKVMYEEGHALQQLTHIWLVIARHPHIFYDYRSQFMTHMVNSLNRLGLPSNSPVETRILSLDLAQLIIAWENLTMKKKKNLAEDGNNTAMPVLPTLSPSRSGDEDFSLNPTLCGIVVSFLVRLALLTTSTSDKNETQLCCKSIMLLTTSLETWNEKAVPRIEYFEKVLGACYAENIAASPSPIEKRFKDKNGKSKTVSHKGSVTTQSNKLPLPKVNPNSKKRPLPTENNDKSGQISVTPSTLATCLEIFLIFLKYTPQNRFLLDNIDYLIVTFRPCFEAANSSNKREEASSNKIKELLQKFIVTLFSKFPDREVAPPELIQSQIFQHIWELMESVLTLSEDNTMSVENSSPNLPTSEAPGRFAPSNRNISKEQQDSDNKKPRKCPLYILQIIDQVYELGNSNFCEYFIQTLLKLAMYLVKTHADAASLGKKSMIAMMSRDGSHSSQHALATPILSVLDEIAGHRNESDVSGEKSVPKIAEPNDAIQSVMLCLKLLSVSSIPYSFSEERKTFFKIFNMLLDQSNNIHLLCQSVGILGNWLLDGADCPLTLSEKQSFIWKTVLFENLPETQAQLLSKMVARIVLSIQDQKMKRETKSKHSTKHLDAVVKDSDLKETKLPLHYDLFLERSIVAGLFGTDSSLRSTFFHLYGRQSSAKHSKASSEYLSSGSIVDRSPLDVLWQLLHSDLEGVGNRFWPLLFVEMLLAISDHGGGVELQNNNDVTVGTSAYHKEDIEKLPLPCDAPLSVLPSVITPSEYHQFTKVIQAEKTAASHGRGRCLSAIRILIHGDVDACADLFKVLLQQSWENLSNSSRLNLLPPLEYLLASSVTSQFLHVSKDWPDKNAVPSSQSSSRYANIIQCILRAFLTLNPIPVLDPCLLITLARNFNCWHEAIQMLEGRYYKSTEDERRTLGSHLRECYEELGERDLATAVMQDVCQNLSLKRAISFDMYGRVMDASAAYNALFGVLVSEQETLSTKQPLSIEELGIWEQRWIETSRESCHWDILYDFSKSNNSTLLLMECAWRSCNWDTVRSLFTTPSFVAALEAGDPRHKMNEIFLAIAGDGKFADVEKLCAQAVQLCLHRWQLLPHLSSKCLSHVSLLQSFQRLVELRESGHIMMEMNAHSSNRTYPDLKNILSAWRDRLPNPWENLIVWEDLFVWRSHIFDAISSNFHWGEPNAVATLHDRPWTSIRLAQIARKQGVTDLSIRSLNRLQADTTMDVSDAFSKLREQIICCRDIKSPDKVNALRSGLNMINTTNLVFFDSYQKSELFRLKASFFSHLGSQSSANQAYCHSVQIMSSYGKAWHSWGRHCHNLAQATEKDAAVSSSTDKKDSTGTLGGKSVQYLAQAMGCFLEAVKCGHGTSSSLHLPRCLWMLRRDENRPGLLCQTLEDKALTLPVWVWLPWIPQLLTGLTRIESRVAKAILSKIIERYPQAVYYTLRAFYLERRDVERARSSSAKVNPAIVEHEQKHGTAVSHSEELMSTLRRKHPALWSSLESILAELIVRFRPSLEEELLAAVTALHQKAIQLYQTSQVSASSIEKEEEVPSNLIHTLSRVSIKFFRSPMDSSDQQKFFCKKYQESFEQDFLGESSSNRSKDKTSTSAESAVSAGVYPSATSNIVKSSNMKMSVLIARLGNWKDVLQCHVLSTPPKLPLQHQSPVLSSIVNEAPDLWKGACESLFPHEKLNCSPTTATSLSGSGAAATAFAAAEAAARAVSAAATSEGCGGSYGGGSSVVEIPGQYPPNFKGPPSPELNAKLIRFDPVVETIRRQGHLVRRIGMLGSDGKTHKFVLQFGIPYLTRTDERTSQLHNVIDMLLQKNMMASRRYLSVRAGAVVPIAQRLRLAADESSHYSLEDVYCLDRSMKGLDPDEPNTFFNEEVTNQLRARRSKRDDKATSSSGEDQQKEIGYKSTTDKFQNSNSDDKSINEEKTSVEKKVKRIVFDKICSNIVPDTILQNFIQDAFQMPDAIFAFRKAFACHAAASSLLQYTMNAAERGPHKFVLNMKNAQIYSPDFRLMYNNQGLLEGTNTVPFRMTRNIESTIGPLMTEGTFVPAMANVASAVQKKNGGYGTSLFTNFAR
uniref:Non-specific serine/threonine protein kinase n=1 Tax=Corethron hystrix TaxID=216773 RepID=A0A7S1B6V0_9STRA